MTVAIIGTKVGMTRVFEGESAIAVTVIEVQSNDVIEVKTTEKHGYAALKVAVGPLRRRPSKPIAGEFKKVDVAPRRFLREIPIIAGVVTGAKVTVSALDIGKLVDVSGLIKGRGFAGVMKRHNFSGHKATHGTCKHRGPGSIGCRMDPGKVWKGKRMAGHWGNEQVTVRNLKIVSVDTERNLVVLKGAIPGATGTLVTLKQA